MTRLLLLTLVYLTSQIANGQACGIYRLEYVGNIAQTNKEIVKVHLPTTLFLHGVEKEKSDQAFIEATLTNKEFKLQINSHLTTPYNEINQLISFYMRQSDKFKMKVSYLENESITEMMIELDWNNIEVSIIEDGKSGTLFRFALNNISI